MAYVNINDLEVLDGFGGRIRGIRTGRRWYVQAGTILDIPPDERVRSTGRLTGKFRLSGPASVSLTSTRTPIVEMSGGSEGGYTVDGSHYYGTLLRAVVGVSADDGRSYTLQAGESVDVSEVFVSSLRSPGIMRVGAVRGDIRR